MHSLIIKINQTFIKQRSLQDGIQRQRCCIWRKSYTSGVEFHLSRAIRVWSSVWDRGVICPIQEKGGKFDDFISPRSVTWSLAVVGAAGVSGGRKWRAFASYLARINHVPAAYQPVGILFHAGRYLSARQPVKGYKRTYPWYRLGISV